MQYLPIERFILIAGTIIPVQRQTPLVQLTPISSSTKVQPSQTSSHIQDGHHQLPVLLPKQSQVWMMKCHLKIVR